MTTPPQQVHEDDELLRETYAQDELDQDRNPTEEGFVEWRARRRAVGSYVPPSSPGRSA